MHGPYTVYGHAYLPYRLQVEWLSLNIPPIPYVINSGLRSAALSGCRY